MGVAASLVAVGALGWWRWRPFRIEIAGRSMVPALMPGDWALAIRTRRVRVGDIVVIEHPARQGFEIVKRVAMIPGSLAPDGLLLGPGQIWIEGDASGVSTDSRTFGPAATSSVKGRVVLIWWPPASCRRVSSP